MGFEGLVILAVLSFVGAGWVMLKEKPALTIEQLKSAARRFAQRRDGRVVPLLSADALTVEWGDEHVAQGQLMLKLRDKGCVCELSLTLQDVSDAWVIKRRHLNGGLVLSFHDAPIELDVSLWRALLGLSDMQPSTVFEASRQGLVSYRFSLQEGKLSWRFDVTHSTLEHTQLEAVIKQGGELCVAFAQELLTVMRAGGEDELFGRLLLSDAAARRWALSVIAQLGWSDERRLSLFEQLISTPRAVEFALEFLSDELLKQLPFDRRLTLLELAMGERLGSQQARLAASCHEGFDVEHLEAEQLVATPQACFRLMRDAFEREDGPSWEVVKARACSGMGRFDAVGYVALLGFMAQYPQRGWEGILEAIPEQALRSTQVIEGVLSYCESSFMRGEGVQGSTGLAQTLVWSMACARQGQLERLVPLLLNVCGELALAPLVEAQRRSETMQEAGRAASRHALERLVGTLKLDAAKIGALSVAADSVQGGLSVAGEAGSLSQVD